ncbi:MAG: cyclodeaminase/cyclohydrolase family protein, partial [Caldisericia bacterium]|nr:cyclodeaminase/cyclohydrolase family protein [Caldisericia bacterium]
MNLKDLSIHDFCKELASKNPTPGGGSAAAAAGALGLSLVLMVGNYAEDQEKLRSILDALKEEKNKLISLIDEDAESFNAFMKTMKMPKSTPDEKKERKEAMQNALKKAADIPFQTLQACSIGTKYMMMLRDDVKENMLSDLGAASTLLSSAINSAYLNVIINANSIKDEDFTTKLLHEAKQMQSNSVDSLSSLFRNVADCLE